jgi:hypothetical protein
MTIRVNDSRDYDDWNLIGFARPTGASDPVFSDINGSGIYNWVFTNGKELHVPGAQLPHAYKEGSVLVPHIHWCPTTTATYTGTWTLTMIDWLTVANGTALNGVTTVTAAFNAAMTAHQIQSQDFSATITGTNRKVSSIAMFKLSLALSAGAGCVLAGLDCHILKDSIGSDAINTKSTV